MATFYKKSDIPEHLRKYFVPAEIGLEPTPDEYVNSLVEVFREVRRVLKKDGTVWLNLGDSYAANRTYQVPSTKGGQKHSPAQGRSTNNTVPEGLKPKDLIGIPWRVAFALQADGWWLRSDIIWEKPNCMPESVKDRPTRSHEYVFLLSKNKKYYYDNEAIKKDALTKPHAPGYTSGKAYAVGPMDRGGHSQRETPKRVWAKDGKRNCRTVWRVNTKPFKGSHFAVFPPELIEPCILAGCPEGGTVLDPFCGSGTTLLTAIRHNRRGLGIELNPKYVEMATERIQKET